MQPRSPNSREEWSAIDSSNLRERQEIQFEKRAEKHLAHVLDLEANFIFRRTEEQRLGVS